jgi:uncharacterized membrane protein (DUF485 family)
MNDYRRVLDDPAFQNLVRERSGFAWSLLAAMLIIYYGFIMLVAFAKPLLAATAKPRASIRGATR